jgi:hypothetical protein
VPAGALVADQVVPLQPVIVDEGHPADAIHSQRVRRRAADTAEADHDHLTGQVMQRPTRLQQLKQVSIRGG